MQVTVPSVTPPLLLGRVWIIRLVLSGRPISSELRAYCRLIKGIKNFSRLRRVSTITHGIRSDVTSDFPRLANHN